MARGISTAQMSKCGGTVASWQLVTSTTRTHKRQASCRRLAQVLGSAVGATRVVTLVHASPRILRHPISDARGNAYKPEQRRLTAAGITAVQILV
ncbi:hypothetical protein V8C42DRAFT_316954 [Trichoderma barbatum]